jgi:hypothetical protein
MKRLQIYIEEELDEALASRAVREHTSKAALIRRYVAERMKSRPRPADPLDALIGSIDERPDAIDDVVYGRLPQ